MLSNQIDVSFDNVRELLELSQQKLVIFDFWVQQHEPCQQILLVLEKIAGDYPEHVVLAKVNCDTEHVGFLESIIANQMAHDLAA